MPAAQDPRQQFSQRDILVLYLAHLTALAERAVEIDPKLVRPAEVDYLCGDASKAKKILGWVPQVTFKQLIEMMVDADLLQLKQTLVGRTANAGV